jgi:hypothetical protein
VISGLLFLLPALTLALFTARYRQQSGEASMSLRAAIAVLGALLLLLAPAGAANAQSTTQESGNPINDQGSNYNYRSYVTGVVPHVPGLSLEVLEFADRLILTNHSGRTVTVYGYQEEPYARVLANGVVQLNTRSPAYYLNQSFYGQVTVPPSASPQASPHWVTVDRTGQLEWHDHRIHWMSPIPPAKVKDKNKRTLIFQWQVPIQVGAHKGVIDGNLFWVPLGNSTAPTAAIVALVALVLLGLLVVLLVRKRRARRPPGAGGASGEVSGGDRGSSGDAPVYEAW